MKNDFPVFLIRKYELHGGDTTTTSDQLFDYFGMILDCVVNGATFVRPFDDLVFDGFRNLTLNSEMMPSSECGHIGDDLAIEQPAYNVIAREEVANL